MDFLCKNICFFFLHTRKKGTDQLRVNRVAFAQLIKAFVFTTGIQGLQGTIPLPSIFQVSSNRFWLYSSFCVRAVLKPRRHIFSQHA